MVEQQPVLGMAKRFGELVSHFAVGDGYTKDESK
jgi:hypothetical protein